MPKSLRRNERMQRQVVITGLGLVSSLGTGKEVFWQSLLEGRSGIRRLTRFDPTGYECQIGGEITDESYQDSIDIKRRRRMSRVTQQAVAAAQMARCGTRTSVKSVCDGCYPRNRGRSVQRNTRATIDLAGQRGTMGQPLHDPCGFSRQYNFFGSRRYC